MSRSINQIKPEFAFAFAKTGFVSLGPKTSCRRRSNRNAALALLDHPVHHGCAFVNFANLMRDAGIKKDSLRNSGFPGVDVSNDAKVSCFFKQIFPSHMFYLAK